MAWFALFWGGGKSGDDGDGGGPASGRAQAPTEAPEITGVRQGLA